LGIGDWAQSPIPNPQSPIPNPQFLYFYYIIYYIIIDKLINLKNIISIKFIKNNYINVLNYSNNLHDLYYKGKVIEKIFLMIYI